MRQNLIYAHFIDVSRYGLNNFKPVTQVSEILIPALFLLCDESVSSASELVSWGAGWDKGGHWKCNIHGHTYPLTPIVKPSASSKGMLNIDRLGISRKRICSSKSSIREMEIDSGRRSSPDSSSSSCIKGPRISYVNNINMVNAYRKQVSSLSRTL